MALNKLVDTRDSRFVLFEMLEIDKLNKFEKFSDFDKDTFEQTLDLAENIAVEIFFPGNSESDKKGSQYVPDTKDVKVPDCIKPGIKAYGEAGFVSLAVGQEDGGMGMPEAIFQSCMEYFCAGCVSASLYPTLTIGAANLIKSFGTAEQKKTYLEKMYSGVWGGTMCLTEPDAGSDVGALKTKAVKQADGTYLITGQKIFISSGENDLYSNIIHPVLARVEGDPKGTKGISIFIVPKFFVNADGSLGKRNDVVCSGIEHKMGLKGSATCSLSFGDNGKCVGYLLGQEKQGMKIMFQMMNEARLAVAMQSQGLSSTAYMHAVTYAKNRVQSIHFKDGKNPDAPPTSIVNHPDVKRMLLVLKSYVEGQRMMMLFTALNQDLAHASKGDEAKEAQGLVELLIPICKAGITDSAVLLTSEAVQVFGGYGYCGDYPVEQFMRDSKIMTLYEGTNGIQSMDLTMRKILLNQDQFNYNTMKKRVSETLKKAKGVVDERYIDIVSKGLGRVDEAIKAMGGDMLSGKMEKVFANATPLRQAMFMLTIAWLHLWSLIITVPKMTALIGGAMGAELEAKLKDNQEAAYYYGKVISSQFFIGNEFLLNEGRIDYILKGDDSVIKSSRDMFTGSLEE